MEDLQEQRDHRFMRFVVGMTFIELGYHDRKLIQKNFDIVEPSEKTVDIIYDDVFVQLVFEEHKKQGEYRHHKWYNN